MYGRWRKEKGGSLGEVSKFSIGAEWHESEVQGRVFEAHKHMCTGSEAAHKWGRLEERSIAGAMAVPQSREQDGVLAVGVQAAVSEMALGIEGREEVKVVRGTQAGVARCTGVLA